MISVSDFRLSFTSGGTRMVIGTREASSAVAGASRMILPSSDWIVRSPNVACLSAGDILLGCRRSRREKRGGKRNERNGTALEIAEHGVLLAVRDDPNTIA